MQSAPMPGRLPSTPCAFVKAGFSLQRLADAAMANAADLWLVADLSDLRDDAGRLDAEKVRAKVAEVVKERAAWRQRTVGFDGGAHARSAPPRSPGLSELLNPGQT